MRLHLVRTAAELGRVAGGEAAEWVIGDVAALDGRLHAFDIGAAEQAIDAEVDRDARRVQRGLRRGAHHFHIRGCAAGADAVGELFQHVGRHAHILESDVAQLRRRDQVHHLQAVGNGAVLAGEHENEIQLRSPRSRVYNVGNATLYFFELLENTY